MSIADQVKMKELETRILAIEKWIEDFEKWPKPDPELMTAAREIVKRGPGRPRKNG